MNDLLYSPPAIRRLLAQRVSTFELIIEKACKNAIKFNTPVDEETAIELGRLLMKCNLPLVCAHGRPTVLQAQLPVRRLQRNGLNNLSIK